MWICVEFYGDGDPFFGGSADDRSLGADGAFLVGCYGRDKVARFASRKAALAAGGSAVNRRASGKLGAWESAT